MRLAEIFQGLEQEKIAAEIKLADDDAYGRVMAHAFVDEIQSFEKAAAEAAAAAEVKAEEAEKEAAGVGSAIQKELHRASKSSLVKNIKRSPIAATAATGLAGTAIGRHAFLAKKYKESKIEKKMKGEK